MKKLTDIFTRQTPIDAIQWSDFPASEAVQKLIQSQLELVLPSVYGYCLVTAGQLASDFDYSTAPVVNVLNLNGSGEQRALCDLVDLPLSNDDMDAIFLPFQLEQSDSPHSILRECYRVLRPGGKLILVMLNPVSLWGLRRLLSPLEHNPVWQVPYYTAGRVMDWLSVLDFKVTISHRVFNPLRLKALGKKQTSGGEQYASSAAHSLIGTINFMVAEKRVIPLTRRPVWSRLQPTGQVGIETLRKTMYSKPFDDYEGPEQGS